MLVTCTICGKQIKSKNGKKKFCNECQIKKQRRKKRIKDNLKKGIVLTNPDIKERKCIDCGIIFEYITHTSTRCDVCRKTRFKKYHKEYSQTEKALAYRKEYGKKRRKEIFELYRLTNSYRQKLKERRWRRKEYMKNIIHEFTYDDWLDLVDKTNGICPGCNKNIGMDKLTLDHIYPVSVAYKDFLKTGIQRIYTTNDIQPLCSLCNGTKNAKIEVK